MGAQLSQNVGVKTIEAMGFSAADMLYRTMLRDLLIQAIDNPDNIWDDRILAMCDGAFNYRDK